MILKVRYDLLSLYLFTVYDPLMILFQVLVLVLVFSGQELILAKDERGLLGLVIKQYIQLEVQDLLLMLQSQGNFVLSL